MSFTNTVTTVGDAKLTDSIIDRSITEYLDDTLTTVGRYSLAGCSALKKVRFPNATAIKNYAFDSCRAMTEARLEGATEISSYAFYNCVELKTVDLNVATSISNSAFTYCTRLEALIIRTPDQVCSLGSNAFLNSGIASGTGYIYVPAALVDSYKADDDWSAYANQIRAIEDYPAVCGYKGKDWTKTNYTSKGECATYADGKFVVLYQGQYAACSTDGITWKISSIGFTPESITYSDGMWLSWSKNYNDYAYSSDGITWTKKSDNKCTGIAYANGLWVRGGYNDDLYYSEDGESWTAVGTGEKNYWYIRYVNGLWLAGGTFSARGIWYSTDGKTWAQSNVTTGLFGVFKYAEGLWMAASGAVMGSSTAGVYYSADGQNWTKARGPDSRTYDIVYANGLWMAGGQNYLYYSSDGVTWTNAGLPNKGWIVDHVGTCWVAGTRYYSGDLYYSNDGTTWIQSNTTSSCSFYGIAHNDAVAIAVGSQGLYYSE